MKSQGLTSDGVMPIHLGGAVVCCLLLAVGWAFGYAPMMTQNHEALTLVEQADQAEIDEKQVKQELDQLANELDAVQASLDEQPVNLQSASKINPLLSQLAQWSELHQLSITRTSAGRPVALVYYDYMPIKIAGEGGFAELLAFFKRMNVDRGDLGLVSFNVNRMAGGSGVTFELDLAWYVLSDDAQGQADQATASVPTPSVRQ